VWARDGAKTVIWSLDLDDPDINRCQVQTLRTILDHQAPTGIIPAHVLIDEDHAEYGGVGGITSIDSALWIIIAVWRHAHHTNDLSLAEHYAPVLQRAMDWLSAHDSNNCGMLEIPEAGDWTDLFARSYHVLYDEVLWYRTLNCYANILDRLGQDDKSRDYRNWAQHVGRVIVRSFWPSTAMDHGDAGRQFSDVQYGMGDSRYLVAQVSPFSFSWRCDVYANLLAYLTNLIDKQRAMMTFRFMWGVGVNEPAPVKNLYPVVHGGDPEWREYFTVNLLNLPDHYHNGGIWPFIGGFWVMTLAALGMRDAAEEQLCAVARANQAAGWRFTEWFHGQTLVPMGMPGQSWNAAAFLAAQRMLQTGVSPL
jgi:glycogen debranching enzyme